jgi:hypothetical protein
MSYRTNMNTLADLRQRLGPIYINGTKPHYPIPYAETVTGQDPDGFDGPHYTLHWWAEQAIFDRVYKPRAEPAVNWRFNLIDRPGLVLTVTPIYEPKEQDIRNMTAPWREGEKPTYTLAEAEETHRLFHGNSNWSMTLHCLLRVLDPATHRTVRGYLWLDEISIHMLELDLAQPVLDTLWAATQGDPRAFAGATHCAFCGHPLSDALSAARGYGPDCAKRFKLPWLRVVSDPALRTSHPET